MKCHKKMINQQMIYITPNIFLCTHHPPHSFIFCEKINF